MDDTDFPRTYAFLKISLNFFLKALPGNNNDKKEQPNISKKQKCENCYKKYGDGLFEFTDVLEKFRKCQTCQTIYCKGCDNESLEKFLVDHLEKCPQLNLEGGSFQF